MKEGHMAVPAGRGYSDVKWRFFLADIAWSVFLMAVFQFFLSGPLSSWLAGKGLPFYTACLAYGSAFLFFMYAASLPLIFADSFMAEHAFNLSEQSVASWLADEAKGAALSYVLWIACIGAFYFFLRNFPYHWWLLVSVAWVAFSVVLTRLAPVLLIPVFFKYMPIEDASMKERIMRLAERCRINLVDVCQIDLSRKTKKANAALVGLGRTRKVIMADTLMKKFTPDEAEAVVAHEFGHYRFRHIWQLIGFSGAVTTAGFFILYALAGKVAGLLGAAGVDDIYMMPALIFLISAFAFVLAPLQNWFSRALERQADRYAVKMAGSPVTFISVMKKLAAMNLADPDPPLIRKILIYNHPPVGERIRMAERMMRGRRTEDR